MSTYSLSRHSTDPDTPLRCFHLRLLHEKCGHISSLEIHEPPCQRRHMGWVLEESPPEPPNPCSEMLSYIRTKDEHCKVCKSYLVPEVKQEAGWFGKKKDVAEKRENPFALPQDVIDARLASWRIQIEQTQKRKMERREIMKREQDQVSSGSGGVRDKPESTKEIASEVAMENGFEDEEMNFEEGECVLTFE